MVSSEKTNLSELVVLSSRQHMVVVIEDSTPWEAVSR